MLKISSTMLKEIHVHGEKSYPEEGVGFLFGLNGEMPEVKTIFIVQNAREKEVRHNRYTVAPQDIIRADEEADKAIAELNILQEREQHISDFLVATVAFSIPQMQSSVVPDKISFKSLPITVNLRSFGHEPKRPSIKSGAVRSQRPGFVGIPRPVRHRNSGASADY